MVCATVTPICYSLSIIRSAVNLSIAKVTRWLSFQQCQTDGTPEAGTVPRASINVEEVLISYRFPACRTGSQLSLKRTSELKMKRYYLLTDIVWANNSRLNVKNRSLVLEINCQKYFLVRATVKTLVFQWYERLTKREIRATIIIVQSSASSGSFSLYEL